MLYKSTLFLVFAALVLSSKSVHSQIDSTISIDLLRGPSSPASNLLGIAASDIEKPSEVNAVMASLKSATNNFSSLPKNYAIDLAPFKIFGKKHLDSKYLDSNKYAFRQSAIFSLGVNSVDKNDSLPSSAGKTQLGIGIKFSIIRGALDQDSKKAFENIYLLQKSNQELILEALRTEAFRSLNTAKNQLFKDSVKAARANQSVEALHSSLDSIRSVEMELTSKTIASLATDYNEKIQQQVANIKLERTGFNLDFSAGTVIDFLDNKFDNSWITKSGAWLTGGFTGVKSPTSILFIARYLYNPATSFADPELKLENLHTLDGGIRLIANPLNKKLLISGEALYRSILNKAVANSSWRLVFNAEYEVATNQRLTFSFGKNFDGQIYEGGNIISALNYIIGFGKEKVSK